ncbi:MAG: hypothetical protein E5Y34_27670 [Mesorhizobium sp.]|uniref:hypothetical protein n=1 Tax=Mesorhizobium sp. TaxID=1871066 RepID=UPI0011FE571F|nr:hypothetical protein [Mesorhizobium sp.]TIM95060.1 MAG: hypothetical protein E5Y34_27670 [Mesorhizobium sp.]
MSDLNVTNTVGWLRNEMRIAQGMAGRYQLNAKPREIWNQKAEHFRDAADLIEHLDQKTGRAAQASPEGVPCGGVSRQDQVEALDAFEKLLIYGRRPEGDGTHFRFATGSFFFLADNDAAVIRSALGGSSQ